MLVVDQLSNGKFIIITSAGDVAFTRTFPSKMLATHFIDFVVTDKAKRKSDEFNLDETYEDWKKVFFVDEVVSEETMKCDVFVISLLNEYFETLDSTSLSEYENMTERDVVQIGACSFVDWLLKNGYTLTKM